MTGNAVASMKNAVKFEYHPYKVFIGKSELTGQAMGGFENLIVLCVGKGTEQGILFLVELSGMQPHHPDSKTLPHKSVCSFMSGLLRHLP